MWHISGYSRKEEGVVWVMRQIRRNGEDVIVDPDIDEGDYGRVWDVNMSNCPTVLVNLNSEVC